MARPGTPLLLLLLLAAAAAGQDSVRQRRPAMQSPPSDTSSRRLPVQVLLPLSFGLHPYRPALVNALPASGRFLLSSTPPPLELDAPWKLQLAQENDYRTIGLILGTMKAGAPGYVAYQHLRKYGLK